jgi:hypothetical protein
MHERYTEFERRRGRNGSRQRGAQRDYEQDDQRDFQRDRDDAGDDERGSREFGARDWERDRNRESGGFGRDFEETPRDRFGRFEGQRGAQGGGSEWRDRFGGSEWEQPRYAGGGFESGRRPFAGGYGGYGERSAPQHRYDEDRSGQSSFRSGAGFGSAGPYGEQSGQGAWGGFGAGSQQQGRHAGKGPKGYQRADDRVLEDANQALERHPEIDASEIEVTCQKGEIVLRGTVEDRNAKRLAEQCIEDLPGVKDVRNELRIQRSQGREAQAGPEGQQATPSAKGESAQRT